MPTETCRTPLSRALLAFALLGVAAASVHAQQTIKIGALYDVSGPFAGGGSKPSLDGALIAMEMVNEKGGVLGKYKIIPVTGDAQSKADVAINEYERMINAEQVDMVVGPYSSAHAVPLAGKADAQHKFLWITTAIATAVFQDKGYKYVFRPQTHGAQFGEASAKFLAEESKTKLGIDPKDLKLAIFHEDGPYGTGVAASNEEWAKKMGFKIVLKEGYSATAPDLSALVIKLKRARPDIMLHTGYNPDITLFLRQSKEQGLHWKGLIGHGAGYGQIDKLRDTFGNDVDYVWDVDPVANQLLDPKTLAPGMGDLIKDMVRRYVAKTGAKEIPPHVGIAFSNTWVLLNDVLPRAIAKHGGWSADALRMAALETDIPEGKTPIGFGVKFPPPGDSLAGQNTRSYAALMQFIGGKTFVSYPRAIRTADPVLPWPKSSPYAE